MKIQSYEAVTDKSIIEVKLYLLMIGKGKYQDQLYDVIDRSVDIYHIKKGLSKNKSLQLWLFSKIKEAIRESDSYNSIEKHLVFINLIFDKNFKPLYDYKYNLFKYITKDDFNIESYCLLRHLIRFKYRILTDFINCLCEENKYNEYQYHYIASYIFLVEEDYRQAYKHLPYIEMDNNLNKYQRQLLNYNPFKYCKLNHTSSINLKEVYM